MLAAQDATGDGPELSGAAALRHMRNVPVLLEHSVWALGHADGGADIFVVTHDAVESIPLALRPPRREPTTRKIMGIGGPQEVLYGVEMVFSIYFSVHNSPMQQRTFSAIFNVIPAVPGGVQLLIAKPMCQPGHAFYRELYNVHSDHIAFFDGEHGPAVQPKARDVVGMASVLLATPASEAPRVTTALRQADERSYLEHLAQEELATLSESARDALEASIAAALDSALEPFAPERHPLTSLALLAAVPSPAAQSAPALAPYAVDPQVDESLDFGWEVPFDVPELPVVAAVSATPVSPLGAASPVPGLEPDLPSDDELRVCVKPSPGWPGFEASVMQVLRKHRVAFNRNPWPYHVLTLPPLDLRLSDPDRPPPRVNRCPPWGNKSAALWAVVDRMVAAGNAMFVSPDTVAYGFCFGVFKPNGSVRFTCNTMSVNAHTARQAHLTGDVMGNMFENVFAMAGVQTHISFDLSDAFNGLALTPEAQIWLTFVLEDGRKLRFLVAPFGPSDMPGHFTVAVQEHIVVPTLSGHFSERLFPGRSLARSLALRCRLRAWLDDINGGAKGTAFLQAAVPSPVEAVAPVSSLVGTDVPTEVLVARADCLELIDRLLECISAAKGRVSIKKSTLGGPFGSHVGLCYDDTSYWLDPSRTKSLVELPQPRTLQQLQAVIACFGYYRFAVRPRIFWALYGPLSALNKASFTASDFTDLHLRHMRALGKYIARAAPLYLPDLKRPVIVHVDASTSYGFGIIMSQWDEVTGTSKLILCKSKGWAANELAWDANTKEAAALKQALVFEAPNAVPWAERLVVIVDHKNWVGEGMANSRNPLVRQWWAQICATRIPFVVSYVSGPLNVADYPSRYAHPSVPTAVSQLELARGSATPLPPPSLAEIETELSMPPAVWPPAPRGPVVLLTRAQARLAGPPPDATASVVRQSPGPAVAPTAARETAQHEAPRPTLPDAPAPSKRGRGRPPRPNGPAAAPIGSEASAAPSELRPAGDVPAERVDITASPAPTVAPLQLSSADAPDLASRVVPRHLSTAPLLRDIVAAQGAASVEQRASWGETVTQRINGFDVVLRSGKVVVPSSEEQRRLLADHHALTLHRGAGPMASALSALVWWPRLKEDCVALASQCPQCQWGDVVGGRASIGHLHPSLSPAPFHTLYIDYLGPLVPSKPDTPGSCAQQYVLGGICSFTRMLLLQGYPSADSANSIAFVRTWAQRHTWPRVIRSDRGTHFVSAAFTAFCEKHNIAFVPGIAYHHSGQGIVERVFKEALRTLIKTLYPAFRRWAQGDRLAVMTSVHNETVNATIGMSPFQAAHGIAPYTETATLLGLPSEVFTSLAEYHQQLLVVHEGILFSNAVGQLCNARDHARTHRPAKPFPPGAHVLVRSENREHKLMPAAEGPFVVVGEQPGEMYELHRVLATADRRVVHVGRLVPFDMALTTAGKEALRRYNDGDDMPANYALVEEVLDHQRTPAGLYEFLVRWLGHPEPSWAAGHGLRRNDVFLAYLAKQSVRIPFAAATRKETSP